MIKNLSRKRDFNQLVVEDLEIKDQKMHNYLIFLI